MKCTLKLTLYYLLYQFGCSFFVSFICIAIGVYSTYQQTGEVVFPENATMPIGGAIAALFLTNVLLGAHLLYYKYVDCDRATTWSPVSRKLLLVVIPLTLSMMFWMNYLMELLALPDLTADLFLRMKDSIVGVATIAIIAPVLEEMLFRGAILGHLLRSGKRPWTAILISALIFGVIHFNPAQVPYAFALGVLLGWLYYLTRSIVPGILLHLVNNGIAVITLLVSDPDTSMEEYFGTMPVLLLSVVGVGITFVCLRYIKRNYPVSGN